MRRFLTLLDKEWRDARTIAAAAAAIAGVGVWIITSTMRSAEYPAIAAQYVLPAIAGLLVAMIGADLVAAETQTRRIEATALLPTRLAKVWVAKATLLAVTGAFFVAWIVACQIAAFVALRPDDVVVTFGYRLVEETWQLGPIAAAACATLFFSTVLGRGMPSLVLGVGIGAGVEAATRPALRQLVQGYLPETTSIGWCALFVATAFAVAAAVAFTKGRVHFGSRTRRVFVGSVALIACLLPAPAAFAGWKRWSWLAIEPGDPSAYVWSASPSPDGKHVALHVAKRMFSTFVPDVSRVWLLDVSGGPVRDVGGPHCGFGGWRPDGRLVAYSQSGDGIQTRFVDPTTLDSVDDRFVPKAELATWWDAPTSKPWYDLDYKPVSGRVGWRTTVTWRERGLRATFDRMVGLGATSGLVYHCPSPTQFVVRDLATGKYRVLAEAKKSLSMQGLSRDGLRALVSIDGSEYAIDLADGRRVAGPWPLPTAYWPSTAKTGRRAIVRSVASDGSTSSTLFDLDAKTSVDLGTLSAWLIWAPDVVELADGRLVATRADGNIDLLESDGLFVRRLYATRRTEN